MCDKLFFCITRADPVCEKGCENDHPAAESRMTIKDISKQIKIIFLDNSPVLVQTTRINSTDYCLCNNCQPMPTAAESVCCQEIPYIQGKFKGKLKDLEQFVICRHNCKQKYKGRRHN